MKRALLPAGILAATAALGSAATAHHSFAVFFDETRTVEIEGTVTAFRFTNPHGTIAVDVVGANGEVEHWRVETTAPVVLQRRGWSRSSIRAGDKVRVSGWPARDGAPYMRLQNAEHQDGTQIGQGFGLRDD